MNGCTAGSRHAINVGAVGRYSSPSLVVLGQSLIHIDSAPVTRNHCAKSGTVLHIVSVNISLIHMLIQCIKRMHVKYLLLKKVKQPGFEPLIP